MKITMKSHGCYRCTRRFSSSRDLDRHLNKRKKTCHPATHHCTLCSKGLSSYRSLSQHIGSCRRRIYEEIMMPRSSYDKNIGMTIPRSDNMKPIKEQTVEEMESDASSNLQDMDQIHALLTRLSILAELINEEKDLAVEFADTVEKLQRLNVFVDDQYKLLKGYISQL